MDNKKILGAAVLVVGGYLVYKYWKGQQPVATAPANPAPATPAPPAAPTASAASFVGADGDKFVANAEVKDSKWGNANGTAPKQVAGKFFDPKQGKW